MCFSKDEGVGMKRKASQIGDNDDGHDKSGLHATPQDQRTNSTVLEDLVAKPVLQDVKPVLNGSAAANSSHKANPAFLNNLVRKRSVGIKIRKIESSLVRAFQAELTGEFECSICFEQFQASGNRAPK
eukprot:2400788-Rhodomonas_salina.3